MLTLIFALLTSLLPQAQTSSPTYLWKGLHYEGQPEGFALPKARDVPTYADKLEKELGELSAKAELTREYEPLLAKLVDLQLRASWQVAYPRQFDVLVSIALARSECLEKLGRKNEALSTLDRLLFDHVPPELKDQLTGPTDAMAMQQRTALADPRLVARRVKLGGINPLAPDAATDPVDATVNYALSYNNQALITELGSRAVPSLQRIITKIITAVPTEGTPSFHAVEVLLKIDEQVAVELILAHRNEGGILWKQHVARAIELTSALTNRGSWEYGVVDGATPPTCLEPAWRDVLVWLVSEPEPLRSAYGMFRLYALRDALTTEMQTALANALCSNDEGLRRETLAVIEDTWGRVTVRPVLERALYSPSVAVQIAAARLLGAYAWNDAMGGAAEHPTPAVRAELASILAPRTRNRPHYNPGTTPPAGDTQFGAYIAPPPGVDVAAVAEKLGRDHEASVRSAIARELYQSDVPASVELCLALANDPSPEVRINLTALHRSDPALRGRVLAILAVDKDPTVHRSMARMFGNFQPTGNGPDSLPGPDSFDPFVEALCGFLSSSSWSDPIETQDVLNKLYTSVSLALRSARGCNRVIPIVCRSGQDSLVFHVLERLVWVQVNSKEALESKPSTVDLMDESTVTELHLAALKGIDQNDSANTWIEHLTSTMWLKTLSSKGIRQLALDVKQPLLVRLASMRVVASSGDDELEHKLRELLQDPGWIAHPVPSRTFIIRLLSETTPALPQEQRERLRDWIVSSKGVRDEVALPALGSDFNLPFTPATAEAIVFRWIDSYGVYYYVVDSALQLLQARAEPRFVEIYRKAAHDPNLTRAAIASMRTNRIDATLPILAECLHPDWMTDGDRRRQIQESAVSAIANFMNDKAVELLLQEIASAPSDGFRKWCFDGLESIRKYQEERSRWDKRKIGEEARLVAITEVLPMLDDKDAAVRGQAARSLGTLGAIEQMPRLIRMLKDNTPSVRDAAQKALDQLNTPNAAPAPGPPTTPGTNK